MKTVKQGVHIAIAALAIAFLGRTPIVQAVSPAPDGGYTGFNTAEGQNALFNLTTGTGNTGLGWYSLHSITTAGFNTAVGAGALFANTADQNTATGAAALLTNTTGAGNTANGAFALFSNFTGFNNTASGYEALYSNTTGFENTAIGAVALGRNTTGGANIALGDGAGLDVFTANGVICIGHPGADLSNTTWISNVYGATTQSGMTVPVIVSNDGQLGMVASSERFKKDIVAMDKASEIILSLRPVTFHYKTDTNGVPQFGLIAEEVAKVNRALVLPDKEGKPYTVRYDAVNAMLLNEFLKEHRRVENLEVTLAQQRKDFQEATARQQKEFESKLAQQQKQLEALTAGLQKVGAHLAAASSSSGKLALSKPAPHALLNNP